MSCHILPSRLPRSPADPKKFFTDFKHLCLEQLLQNVARTHALEPNVCRCRMPGTDSDYRNQACLAAFVHLGYGPLCGALIPL